MVAPLNITARLESKRSDVTFRGLLTNPLKLSSIVWNCTFYMLQNYLEWHELLYLTFKEVKEPRNQVETSIHSAGQGFAVIGAPEIKLACSTKSR